jgi:hypothetical protein
VDNRLFNGCPGMGLIASFPADLYWRRAAISLSVNHDPLVAFAHGLTILVFVVACPNRRRHPRRLVLLLAFGRPVASLGATLVDTQRITRGGASFRYWCVAVEFHCQI